MQFQLTKAGNAEVISVDKRHDLALATPSNATRNYGWNIEQSCSSAAPLAR
jgi:predicted secreted protein